MIYIKNLSLPKKVIINELDTKACSAIVFTGALGSIKISLYDNNLQFWVIIDNVFNNIKLILEASGSSWNNMVDVTVFLTNMKDDFAIYNKLWAEYFAENPPCRTTIEINCLPTPIAIELKVIATIG